jgi:sulfur relay (sulfurtransferase) DsrC/TusE family protein
MASQYEIELTEIEIYVRRDFSDVINHVKPMWLSWDNHVARLIPDAAERKEKLGLRKDFFVVINLQEFANIEYKFPKVAQFIHDMTKRTGQDSCRNQVLGMLLKEAIIESGRSRTEVRNEIDPIIFPD